jgi:hypothetical protein
MDYELIFWCVLGGISLVFLVLAMLTPVDEPVSRDTIRRLCGERTH